MLIHPSSRRSSRFSYNAPRSGDRSFPRPIFLKVASNSFLHSYASYPEDRGNALIPLASKERRVPVAEAQSRGPRSTITRKLIMRHGRGRGWLQPAGAGGGGGRSRRSQRANGGQGGGQARGEGVGGFEGKKCLKRARRSRERMIAKSVDNRHPARSGRQSSGRGQARCSGFEDRTGQVNGR